MPEPLPVEVVSPVPIPVKVVGNEPSHIQSQISDPSIPAKTTFQEDLTFAGQRRVNLIWEYTQSIIALLVIVTTMISGILSMIYAYQIPTIVSVAFGTITGFYFSRTNHSAIGGIGIKPESQYVGR